MICRRACRLGRAALGALAVAVPLLMPAAGPSAASVASPADWLQWTPSTHTVSLTLIAGYNAARHGFNFNGYSTGTMLISVPVGARVNVTFRNNGAFPHSAIITGYGNRSRAGTSGFPLAFAGAHTVNPQQGTPPGKTEHFTFVANRMGRYAIVCSVGRHAQAGMWDTFMVSPGGDAYLQLPQS